MKTTGPNHWTRPPASQRQRWDADAPLERMPHADKYTLRTRVAILGLCGLFGLAIITMLCAAVLS